MGFWDRKLGPTTPPAPASAPVYAPNDLPRGMDSDHQAIQRAVNDYMSRLPGQQFQQVVPGRQQQQPLTPQQQYAQQYQPDPLDPDAQFKMAVRTWQGGPGKQETARVGSCPQCGSNNFFSRSTDQNGMPLRMPPAPECWECGYPRGQGVLAGTAATEGPRMAARQGQNPGQAYGSQNELRPSIFANK